jgi:hypothetical protein
MTEHRCITDGCVVYFTRAMCNNCKWCGKGSSLQYNENSHIDNLYDLCPECLSDNTEVFAVKKLDCKNEQ